MLLQRDIPAPRQRPMRPHFRSPVPGSRPQAEASRVRPPSDRPAAPLWAPVERHLGVFRCPHSATHPCRSGGPLSARAISSVSEATGVRGKGSLPGTAEQPWLTHSALNGTAWSALDQMGHLGPSGPHWTKWAIWDQVVRIGPNGSSGTKWSALDQMGHLGPSGPRWTKWVIWDRVVRIGPNGSSRTTWTTWSLTQNLRLSDSSRSHCSSEI